MNRVRRAVNRVSGRLRTPPPERRDGYAFCRGDAFWFRPAYTEGKCPLCGIAPAGAPPAGFLEGVGRSWYGFAALTVESLGMLALVLFMYFRG